MEVLSDILRSMRVRGSVYFCDGLKAPWSRDVREKKSASFHHLRRGECWVSSSVGSERLGPGDLLFVEPGFDHVLSSHAPDDTEPTPGAMTLLLCGYCGYERHTTNPLIKSFPAMTIVREEELLQHPWLKSTLDQLSTEYMSQKPGAEIVVDKLSEVLLVELIRINFGRSEQSPLMRALSDQHIAQALKRLHLNPQMPWTLDNLASNVAMSRAAFSKRFKELVGQTMFEYLTGLRMQRAQELLGESELPLYEIASRAGYESDLSFTKAFKRLLGVTPTQYRKAGRQPEAPNA